VASKQPSFSIFANTLRCNHARGSAASLLLAVYPSQISVIVCRSLVVANETEDETDLNLKLSDAKRKMYEIAHDFEVAQSKQNAASWQGHEKIPPGRLSRRPPPS
jgi:hypothetical protein